MAKKKGLAANKRRRQARNPSKSLTVNPPVGRDITHVLLPGFGAYAVTRFLSRVVYSMVQKRSPKLGKHAGALAALAGFGGAWFFAHKIKKIEDYHDGIIIGSGIAALQTIVRTYTPKYGWIVSDYKPGDVDAPPKAAQIAAANKAAELENMKSQLEGSEGWDEYSHLEAQLDAMAGTKTTRAPSVASLVGKPMAGDDDSADYDPDLMSVLDDDEDMDDLYGGTFAEGGLN